MTRSVTAVIAIGARVVIPGVAIVACGTALVFGGEISEFIRRIVMLVLVHR